MTWIDGKCVAAATTTTTTTGKTNGATGIFTDTMNSTGWSTLHIVTSTSSNSTTVSSGMSTTSLQQAHAAGCVEAKLTVRDTYNYWLNYLREEYGVLKPPSKVVAFMQHQLSWLRAQIAAPENAHDKYWRAMGLVIAQWDGFAQGIQQFATPEQLSILTKPSLYLLCSVGDLETINGLVRHWDLPIDRVPLPSPGLPTEDKLPCSALISVQRQQQQQQLVSDSGHKNRRHSQGRSGGVISSGGGVTSAVVVSDVYASQATWRPYYAMLRIYKIYEFGYYPQKVITLASSPGLLHSKDDFLASPSLYVAETTNMVSNASMVAWNRAHTNTTATSWQRSMVATGWSSSGAEWVQLFARENNGAYNNQWMVLDATRVTVGKALPETDVLWIAEQVPGTVATADVTRVLREKGYWPSYNVPYISEIYNWSGYPENRSSAGGYDGAPRARIFRRDAPNVNSWADFKRLIRYNDFQHDPICAVQQGQEEEKEAEQHHRSGACAISARGDLQRGGTASAFGGIDAKVLKVTDMHAVLPPSGRAPRVEAQSGPSHDQQPPFSWSQFPNVSHNGLPEVYNFDWVVMDNSYWKMGQNSNAKHVTTTTTNSNNNIDSDHYFISSSTSSTTTTTAESSDLDTSSIEKTAVGDKIAEAAAAGATAAVAAAGAAAVGAVAAGAVPSTAGEKDILRAVQGFQASISSLPLSSSPQTPSPPPPPPILPNLPYPQALQGHDDENWPFRLVDAEGRSTPALEARYAALAKLRPGIRRYNMFWNSLETVPSQAEPFACPSGSTLVPASRDELKASGFKRFHCYSTRQLTTFETVVRADASIGAQSAGILYSAPPFYRHPNCTGFVFGKDIIKGGCAPRPEHMDDYEDYVLALMTRLTPLGLHHFVLWNEVASAGWMDCSPYIPNRAGIAGINPLTDAQFDYWVSKYAEMVMRADNARAHAGMNDSAVLYLSIDRLWERHPQLKGQPLHTGTRPFLDRLWPKLLAANVTFATAVHPYGTPTSTAEWEQHPQAFTFASVHHVSEYAVQQLAQYGTPSKIDPNSARGRIYQMLFASEQGWPFPACCANPTRARFMCYAQALMENVPQMLAVTHNYFHDNPSGSEQGGQDYGLIPGNVTANLSNGRGHPTFDAYVSTSPTQWGGNDAHYCCREWDMGCANPKAHGTFDPLAISPVILTEAEEEQQQQEEERVASAPPPGRSDSSSGIQDDSDSAGGLLKLQVHGWAWDAAMQPAGTSPVRVRLEVDGRVVVSGIVANISRPDIFAAGAAPDPDHGFMTTLPPLHLDDGKVHLVRAFLLRADVQNTQEEVGEEIEEEEEEQTEEEEEEAIELASSPRCIKGRVEVSCP